MYISSVGYYLPTKIASNEELLDELSVYSNNVDHDKLKKKLDLNLAKERHFLGPDETGMSIAQKAIENCLNKGNIDPMEIDLIMYVSMYREYIEPPMSLHLREYIGARNAHAFDLSNACMGFLNAMEIAKMYFETNKYKTVLIVSSELGSHNIPWDMYNNDDKNAGFSALTVSDGAAAMVLKKGGNDKNFNLFDMNTYSEYKEFCKIRIGKGEEDLKLIVQSRQLAVVALKIMSKYIPKIVSQAEELLGGIDNIFIHQVTGDLTKFCGDMRKDLFEKVHSSFPVVGNTGSASIPIGMSIAEEEGVLKRGNKVVTIVGASGFTCGTTAFIY